MPSEKNKLEHVYIIMYMAYSLIYGLESKCMHIVRANYGTDAGQYPNSHKYFA